MTLLLVLVVLLETFGEFKHHLDTVCYSMQINKSTVHVLCESFGNLQLGLVLTNKWSS